MGSRNTWEENSIRISPVGVISSVFPHIDAGLLNTSDIDGNPWDGNAHYAPDNTTYHLYITYSLNALDDEPIFHTMRVTDDLSDRVLRLPLFYEMREEDVEMVAKHVILFYEG